MKNGELRQIPIDVIFDPDLPMRTEISYESVADLVASIRQIGIIEPLVVRAVGEKYQVIAGHRRLTAAKIAQLTTVPCVVTEADDYETEIIKLHENFARAEISAVDWAKHLTRLKQHYHLTTDKLGEILGMSKAWVSQHLKILEYDAYILDALENNKISFSSARELALIKDPKTREAYVGHAVKGGVSPALAVRWRIQANQPTLPPAENTTPADTPTIETPTPSPYLQCAVCNENIPLGEEVTLTIHHACQPQ